jgi:hypothetical protein
MMFEVYSTAHNYKDNIFDPISSLFMTDALDSFFAIRTDGSLMKFKLRNQLWCSRLLTLPQSVTHERASSFLFSLPFPDCVFLTGRGSTSAIVYSLLFGVAVWTMNFSTQIHCCLQTDRNMLCVFTLGHVYMVHFASQPTLYEDSEVALAASSELKTFTIESKTSGKSSTLPTAAFSRATLLSCMVDRNMQVEHAADSPRPSIAASEEVTLIREGNLLIISTASGYTKQKIDISSMTFLPPDVETPVEPAERG